MADNDYMTTQEVLTGIKTWVKKEIGTNIYDISANHNDAKYADLSAALGTNGANIPQSLRKGGMSIKFVQSSDNKYVQFRLMADSFSTTVTDWQGVDTELKAESHNLIESGGVFHLLSLDENVVFTSKEDNKIILDNGSIISNNNNTICYFDVTQGKSYRLVNVCDGSGYHQIVFLDSNENVIGVKFDASSQTINKTFSCPNETTKIAVNNTSLWVGDFVPPTLIELKLASMSDIQSQLDIIKPAIENLKYFKLQSPSSTIDVRFMLDNGSLVYNSGYRISYYDVYGGEILKVTNICQGDGFHHLLALNNSNSVIQTWQEAGGSISDYSLTIPSGATKLVVNTSHWTKPFIAPSVYKFEILNGADVNDDIENIEESILELDDRVSSIENNINSSISVTKNGNLLYIRTSFDNTRDTVTLWKISNSNRQMSQEYTWLGNKSSSLADIVAQTPNHILEDTVPPYCTNNYWFISGGHGYIIPLIQTDVTLPSDSIGSIWEDENHFQYKVYSIDGTKIYLIPLIVANGGGQGKDTRGWNFGTQMSSTLSHVSGGTYTSELNVLSTQGYQFYTIFNQVYKRIVLDGNEITDNGTFKGRELKVIERFICVDPKTINDFHNVNGSSLFDCTRTYIFFKNTVMCREMFDVKSSIWGKDYGSQPMGLRTFGNYKPMLFIPKCKEITYDGSSFDWKYPSDWSSPRQGIKTYFYNNTTDIETLDDLPDRVIEYHKDDINDLYGIGYASGLSLITGITKKTDRVENTNLAFTFSNDDRNKVYFKGLFDVNSVFQENELFEIVRYYSYFNPSDGDAMTYFYKENNKVIVYVHCFQQIESGNIILPFDFDGMEVSEMVEKTNNISLLTSSVDGNILKFKTANNQYSYMVFILS